MASSITKVEKNVTHALKQKVMAFNTWLSLRNINVHLKDGALGKRS